MFRIFELICYYEKLTRLGVPACTVTSSLSKIQAKVTIFRKLLNC